MKIVRDAKGKEWQLSMRVGAMQRVKAGCEVNFLDMKMESLEQIFQDLLLVSDVLYYLMQPEASNRDMDKDAFQEQWDMQTLLDAVPLLLEELAEFYPPWMRSQLMAAAATFRKTLKQAAEAAQEVTPEQVQTFIAEQVAANVSPSPSEEYSG